MLGYMKLANPSAGSAIRTGDDLYLEPIPSDWTNSLLERLNALECPCVSSGCLCSKTAYIRERTLPAMSKNKFVALAKKAGLDHSEALEHYRNYLSDARCRETHAQMRQLGEKRSAVIAKINPDMPQSQTKALLASYKAYANESHAITDYVLEPIKP